MKQTARENDTMQLRLCAIYHFHFVNVIQIFMSVTKCNSFAAAAAHCISASNRHGLLYPSIAMAWNNGSMRHPWHFQCFRFTFGITCVCVKHCDKCTRSSACRNRASRKLFIILLAPIFECAFCASAIRQHMFEHCASLRAARAILISISKWNFNRRKSSTEHVTFRCMQTIRFILTERNEQQNETKRRKTGERYTFYFCHGQNANEMVHNTTTSSHKFKTMSHTHCMQSICEMPRTRVELVWTEWVVDETRQVCVV